MNELVRLQQSCSALPLEADIARSWAEVRVGPTAVVMVTNFNATHKGGVVRLANVLVLAKTSAKLIVSGELPQSKVGFA